LRPALDPQQPAAGVPERDHQPGLDSGVDQSRAQQRQHGGEEVLLPSDGELLALEHGARGHGVGGGGGGEGAAPGGEHRLAHRGPAAAQVGMLAQLLMGAQQSRLVGGIRRRPAGGGHPRSSREKGTKSKALITIHLVVARVTAEPDRTPCVREEERRRMRFVRGFGAVDSCRYAHNLLCFTAHPMTRTSGGEMGRHTSTVGSRPTQADVARTAGVSQATVSMALNGGPESQGRLTDETRQRILAAVEETGYWGNLAAKQLAGGRTSIFGVFTYEPVFPHDTGDFYYPFLRGIEAEALQHDVDLLLFTSSHGGDSGSSRDGLRDWARRGRLHLADGCLLFGRHSHRRDLSELLAHDYPFVFIGRREADGAEVPYVGADYSRATEEVVEHFA